jgi:DMSO/TMAO reductase YedYZ molybdopterin-dependent catalytic subunit
VSRLISRRGLVIGGAAAAGTLVTGCARVDSKWPAPAVLDAADALTRGAQRLLLGQRPLARELSLADISAHFPLSGTFMPKADTYKRLLDEEFASWRLRVHGLVERPLALSLAELRALPSRTQITLHQCDEGWSAVAQWTGVPLARVLGLAGLQKRARYAVFHCLDQVELDGNYYYESLDLLDATHPQTILAYGMNGKPLPVQHGAPLRLRVELQIGYKNAKYVDRIEVVDSLGSIGKGRGGWWEDFDHAIWYAGL